MLMHTFSILNGCIYTFPYHEGDHCGLFRPHQDPAKGYWLEIHKTLKDYFLNNGVSSGGMNKGCLQQ